MMHTIAMVIYGDIYVLAYGIVVMVIVTMVIVAIEVIVTLVTNKLMFLYGLYCFMDLKILRIQLVSKLADYACKLNIKYKFNIQ